MAWAVSVLAKGALFSASFQRKGIQRAIAPRGTGFLSITNMNFYGRLGQIQSPQGQYPLTQVTYCLLDSQCSPWGQLSNPVQTDPDKAFLNVSTPFR